MRLGGDTAQLLAVVEDERAGSAAGGVGVGEAVESHREQRMVREARWGRRYGVEGDNVR